MSEKSFKDLECAKFLASFNMKLEDIGQVLYLMEDEKLSFGAAILESIQLEEEKKNDDKKVCY